MKKEYEAPDVEFVVFAANEHTALLDGHPDESGFRQTRAGEYFDPSWGEVDIPPKN